LRKKSKSLGTAPMLENRPTLVIIGAGIYGCYLSTLLRVAFPESKIALIEEKHQILGAASTNNQRRIHMGYHYPKSFLTAARSRINFDRFVKDFSDSIVKDFTSIYAVPHSRSSISPSQFVEFCKRIRAPLRNAAPAIAELFDPTKIAAVFETQEYVYDVTRLREQFLARLSDSRIELLLNHRVSGLKAEPGRYCVQAASQEGRDFEISADLVFNCTYSHLNSIFPDSDPCPLKYEFAEMALMEMPPSLQKIGVTLVCGPFFSLMPYPGSACHTLSHVIYTPHFSYQHPFLPSATRAHPPVSRWRHMVSDAARYLPSLTQAKYQDSIWETKAIVATEEKRDGRPILIHRHSQHPGVFSVLGSKIDNIYELEGFIPSWKPIESSRVEEFHA
jgi:glycine/D-amino acid oxidase-like deaminating enzyme